MISDAPKRVLIVEDEEMLRRSLSDYLEDEDFEVFTASSGEEGLSVLEKERADMCIVDMRLPKMDGNDFILAAHLKCPGLRFIIHTGSVSYSVPTKLRKIGITSDQVYHKPVRDMGILVEALYKLQMAGKDSDPGLPPEH